jgi:hypothetical protein
MAFISAITEKTVFGNKRIHKGTFENTGGSTGGDIETGLQRVDFIHLQHSGASAVASAPAVNETLPLVGGAVTIVTTGDADGYWSAEGV